MQDIVVNILKYSINTGILPVKSGKGEVFRGLRVYPND
jgi:hypothetical protein